MNYLFILERAMDLRHMTRMDYRTLQRLTK
jgi:hypothetical protein